MKSFCGGEREKLLTPWRYLLLFGVVAVGFYFAQPERAFVMELATAPTAADTVTARYLDAAVAANPDDRELAIARAKQLLAHGEIESVYVTMEPIAQPNDRLGYRARLMIIEALSTELFADARRVNRATFFERLQEAAGDEWATLGDLRRLFELALGHGRPGLGARVAERMARLDVFARRAHLEVAAKWHLAAGDPLATTRVLELIAYESDDPDTFRQFVIQSIKRRLESGDPRPAMDHALAHAREFPDDAELLNEVMALARRADRPDVAMEVGRLLVGLALDDPGVVHAQVDREIAAGNLRVALRICGERLDRAPHDVRALQKKAQLLVWTDRAPEALEPWAELIRLGVYDDLPRALTVATQIGEDRRLIEILVAARTNRPLDRELTLRLAQAHERVGQVDAALEVLRTASETSESDVVIWLELARLEKDLGRLEDSIATRRQIDERFGLDAASALSAAKDLVKAGQDGTALDLLERYAHQAQDDDSEYWQALAKLAWELEADDSAYEAHVRLWKSGNLERTVLGRLQTLAREGQDLKVALEASWDAWETYHRPEDLLAALAAARQLVWWELVDRGLAEAEARLDQFDAVPEYWVAVALRSADRGDLRGAEDGYDRAMAIAPNRDDLRLDFMWLLLDHDRMRRFLGAYRQWESRIRAQPAYWAVAAVGLRRLERHEEARAYLDRHVRRAAHRDLTAVLDYVSYLEQLGYGDSADRLRRHTYAAHARELAERLRVEGSGARLPMSPYHEVRLGEWIRGDWGTDAVDGWVDTLERRSADVGLFHRTLLAHYAATDQAEVARARYRSRDHTEAHRWQQMSQALLSYDLDATAEALEAEPRHGEGALDRVAEIAALRRLGREEEAYALSRRTLGESTLEADPANSQLLRFGVATGQNLPAASRGRFDRRDFGGMTIDTLSADSAWSAEPWTVHVHVRRTSRAGGESDLRLHDRE
ncbi:MAG: tetratricopeptide repeat protein, partial [Planctomycetota bacterium]